MWLLTVRGHAGFRRTVGESHACLDDIRTDDRWTRPGSYSPPGQRGHGHVYVLSTLASPLGLLRWADAGRGRDLAGHPESRLDLSYLAGAAPRRAHPLGGVHDLDHLCDVEHRVAGAGCW